MSQEECELTVMLFEHRHDGPVWQVAWAHPKFGCILASCSYDGRVVIWKEENGAWSKIKEFHGHSASSKWHFIEMLDGM